MKGSSLKAISIEDLRLQLRDLQRENARLNALTATQETVIRERDETISRCLARGIRLRDVLVYLRDTDGTYEDVQVRANEALSGD